MREELTHIGSRGGQAASGANAVTAGDGSAAAGSGVAAAGSGSATAGSAQRERFGSRLGFLLISAGCAVGLGNVWRFPYITGEYGGAAFVLIYLLFLVVFALPVLIMEYSMGRASQKGIARVFDTLEKKGSKWHVFKWPCGLVGNYLLMMFYTVVTGWMLIFAVKSATGAFGSLSPEEVSGVFGEMLGNPAEMVGYLAAVVALGVFVTNVGLRRGVERVTKVIMTCLLLVLIVLVVRSVTLPGAEEGLAFYLMPDFGKLFGNGPSGFFEACYAAMGQAFFTLGLGVGSMMIFGSYLGKDRSLTGEAVRVAGIDTFVAIMAGLIIFPACFAFGVEPGSGPGLVFITLPSVFAQMPMGQLWCTLFFLFMSCAALSTIIAVFENIMAFSMDQWGLSRRSACIRNGIALFLLSLPCLLGYNLWSDFVVPGIGDIQSLEDFVLSSNLLPLGALVFVLFCTHKRGWGMENFLAEADQGRGARFPRWAATYVKYVLPVLLVIVWIGGWIPVIMKWLGAA